MGTPLAFWVRKAVWSAVSFPAHAYQSLLVAFPSMVPAAGDRNIGRIVGPNEWMVIIEEAAFPGDLDHGKVLGRVGREFERRARTHVQIDVAEYLDGSGKKRACRHDDPAATFARTVRNGLGECCCVVSVPSPAPPYWVTSQSRFGNVGATIRARMASDSIPPDARISRRRARVLATTGACCAAGAPALRRPRPRLRSASAARGQRSRLPCWHRCARGGNRAACLVARRRLSTACAGSAAGAWGAAMLAAPAAPPVFETASPPCPLHHPHC